MMHSMKQRLECTPSQLPEDFAFGKPNSTDYENARALTSQWTEHVPSKVRIDSNSLNFMKINGCAAKNKEVSAKLINALAKRKKVESSTKGPEPNPVKLDPNSIPCSKQPDMTFGLPSRISTPIRALIRNEFGNVGERDANQRYMKYHEEMVTRGQVKATVKHTKASCGHTVKPAISEKPLKELFKMKKFLKVESKIKNSLKVM